MNTLSQQLYRVIISAPFGNYLRFPYATSTVGTFTRQKRAGFFKRWWRVAWTLRPHFWMRSWTNRLGLPNPGIDSVSHLAAAFTIVSVTGRNNWDWGYVLNKAVSLHPLAIELNLSCPNTPGELDESDYVHSVFPAALETGVAIIAKLPPVNYKMRLTQLVDAGIRNFHCCNSLPTPAGGLSGKALKPLSLDVCHEVSQVPHDVLIGGGGSTGLLDMRDYQHAGATHYAVGSACLNPLRWHSIAKAADTLMMFRKPSEVLP